MDLYSRDAGGLEFNDKDKEKEKNALKMLSEEKAFPLCLYKQENITKQGQWLPIQVTSSLVLHLCWITNL
jgi:hypothetical protein